MSSITIDVPDSLATRLHPVQAQIPQILELGLNELDEQQARTTYTGLDDVLEYLAGLPSPVEVVELRPSPALDQRIGALLAKNRSAALTQAEERELDQYEYIEHLVRVAKAKARIMLSAR